MTVVQQVPSGGVDSTPTGPDRPDAVHAVAVPGDPVRVEHEPCHRIVFADGVVVDVLTSYPVRPDADLVSLVRPIDVSCADCRVRDELTLVAVREHRLLCPSCYASLGAVRGPPRTPTVTPPGDGSAHTGDGDQHVAATAA
ncbi:hypothetical protein [Saccharomonospora saliphila]|uniref:hypothetical protein n=1 Tax=Saccharomonospora saliphila TaxID=369829 RepID=UPI0003674A93|nr:hypothetical protein [Saccharomonospora saliphila]